MIVLSAEDERRRQEECFWKEQCREYIFQLTATRLHAERRIEALNVEVDNVLDALDDVLDALELELDLNAHPAPLDRKEAYRIIALCAAAQNGHELFDPEWTKPRDEAYCSVAKAIGKLKRVLRARYLEVEVQGLERELEKLRTAKYESRLGSTDWRANTRARLLSQDRASMKWGRYSRKGGSPSASWVREAREQLCEEAGVSSLDAADELLKAARLTRGYPPTRKTPRKK